MTTREEEMAQLRARYAKQFGKGKQAPVDRPGPQKPAPEQKRPPEPEKKKKKEGRFKNILRPYLYLLESDFRKLFRMKPKEQKHKPLDLSWLEKKGGKFW